MATLSSPGVGSGLDINSLISQLMTVEQRPVLVLNQKEASFQAKISALGSLKSALSALQTTAETLIPSIGTTAADKYTSTSATVADSTLATANATNGVAAGNYSLSNITLAHAHQISKSGFVASAEAGTLSITVGSGSAVTVNIAANATLSEISAAINASGAEVSASIINDGTNDFLILTAKNSGDVNMITVTGTNTGVGTEFDFFDYAPPGANNSWVQQQDATDATVTINGIPVTSQTNSITTAISGLTLNLLKEDVGPTTLTVSKSNGAVANSLNAFIKAYNDAVIVMKNLGNYDAASKKASTLTGDSTLRSAQAQLRTALFSASGGSNPNLQLLSDLGVSVQTDGSLKLDSSKLTAAITSDFSSVATLVANVGTKFKTAVSGLVSADGPVSARIDGINVSVKEIGKRRDEWALRLQKIESNYRRQFTALDVQLSKLQSTSASLTQQLAGLAALINFKQ